MLQVLGLDPADPAWGEESGGDALEPVVDALVRGLLEQRTRARADKDWATADRIRDALAAAGVVVEDGADGATWRLAD